MDFEEQLEKAEKLSSPSLVGSSLRSADDSAHNNYIHPEKSNLTKVKGKGKGKGGKKPKKDIATSLDDLINEGALLGSEEDFDKFLDDSGNIKDNAKYSGESAKNDEKSPTKPSPLRKEPTSSSTLSASPLKQVHKPISPTIEPEPVVASSDVYSTPNLSEYQLENQINHVDDLIESVKSHDPARLPKTSSYKSQSIKANKKNLKIHDLDNPEFKIDNQSINSPFIESGLHTPYFHTDDQYERDGSRSRSTSRFQDRSRSRSNKPHLARGDSYKNIHQDEPSKYELPPEFQAEVKEEEIDERQSRQTRPTMKEKIETLEKQQEIEQDQVRQYHNEEVTRDPSLVTTGDYSNFNVDTPQQEERFYDSNKIYAQRSISSTNYLRNISRSRSRQAGQVEADEKNDSNPSELVKEGAFVSDDPYSTIDNLDTMVEEVLHVNDSSSLKNKSNPSDDLKSKTVDQNNNVKDLKLENDAKVEMVGEKADQDSKVGDNVVEEDKSRDLDSKSVTDDGVVNADDNDAVKVSEKDEVKVSDKDEIKVGEEVEYNTSDKDEADLGEEDEVTDEANIVERKNNVVEVDDKEDVAGVDDSKSEIYKDLKGDNLKRDIFKEDASKSATSKEQVLEDDVDLSKNINTVIVGGSHPGLDDFNTEEAKSEKSPNSLEELKADEVADAGTEDVDSNSELATKTDAAEKKELDNTTTPDEEPESTKAISKRAEEELPNSISKKSDSEDILSDERDNDSDDGNDKSDDILNGEPNEVQGVEVSTDNEVLNQDRPLEAIDSESKVVTDIDEKSENNKFAAPNSKVSGNDIEESKEVEPTLTKDGYQSKFVDNLDDDAATGGLNNTEIAENVGELIEDKADATMDSIITPSKPKNTIPESPEKPLNLTSKVVENSGSTITSLSALSKDQDLAPRVEEESSEDLMAQLMKELDVESGRDSELEEKELSTVEDKMDPRDEKEDGEKSTSVLKSGEEINEINKENDKKSTSATKLGEIINEKGKDDTSKPPEITEPNEAEDLNDTETTESIPRGISKVGVDFVDKIKDADLPQVEESKDTEITSELKDNGAKDRNVVDTSNADSMGKDVTEELPKEEVTKSIEAETKVDSDLDDFDFEVSPEEIRKHLESQPVYLFTSLAGGMQIMPRTNRLATILQANGIKFEYRDLGTDEEAKKIWKRQANGKTLPGVVRSDDFIGNWKEIDDANEEYRLHELLFETL